MATGTAGGSARQYSYQMVHYLRKSITYLDAGTTVTVGTIPAGALILKPLSGVFVNVAFSTGTPTVSIGASSDSGTNNFATLLDTANIAFVPFDEAVTTLVAVDTIVQAAVAASATVGEGEIVICYIPDNDL